MAYKIKATALKNLKQKENFNNKSFDLFREDYDCIKQALMNGDDITDSLSSKMLDDREIALLACKVSETIYKNIKNIYQENDEFVLANLNHLYGGKIPPSFTSVDFFNDEMMKILMNKNPLLLKACPKHIRSNKEYVKLAYIRNVSSIINADSTLLNDKEFILDLIETSPTIYQFCSLKDDIDINRKMLTMWEQSTEFASVALKTNVQWMKEVIKINKKIYGYAPLEIRENREIFDIALTDIKNNDIPYLMLCNKEVAIKRLAISFELYRLLPEHIKNDDDIIDVLFINDFSRIYNGREFIPPKYEILFENTAWINSNKVYETLKPVILKNKLSKELTEKPQTKQRTMKI